MIFNRQDLDYLSPDGTIVRHISFKYFDRNEAYRINQKQYMIYIFALNVIKD